MSAQEIWMKPVEAAEETAWLRHDGMAVHSVSGTPILDQVLTLTQLKFTIFFRTGSMEKARAFLIALLETGHARLPLLLPGH